MSCSRWFTDDTVLLSYYTHWARKASEQQLMMFIAAKRTAPFTSLLAVTVVRLRCFSHSHRILPEGMITQSHYATAGNRAVAKSTAAGYKIQQTREQKPKPSSQRVKRNFKAISLLQHPAGRTPSSDWPVDSFKNVVYRYKFFPAQSKTKKIIS